MLQKKKILLVDDEPEIREMIADFLIMDEKFLVTTATDGYEALKILADKTFDLVLSDINMPGMKGFELLKEVRDKYPLTKRVLITAYNVEDYIEMALKHDIGNIFVKSSPFNFSELLTILNNLIDNNIFGLEGHFSSDAQLQRFLITKSTRLDEDARKIISLIGCDEHLKRLELVIVELLTNAIFYGSRNESPEQKELWSHDFELVAEKAIEVSLGIDEEKYAISIRDKGGRLKKNDVLYWLNRQITRDETGLPVGLFDSHGRGFFIARRYIDRLIVNIDRNRQTEVIIINYFSSKYPSNKPLYINEL